MRVRTLALIGLVAGSLSGCDALNQGGLVPPPDTEQATETGPAGEVPADNVSSPGEAPSGDNLTTAENTDATAAGDTAAAGGNPAAGSAPSGVADAGAMAAATPEAADAAGAAPGTAGGADPAAAALPGDMLTAAEMQQAESLALQSVAVKDMVGAASDRDAVLQAASRSADAAEALSAMSEKPSYRVIYTQRYAEKGAQARAAEVAIYRYDTGETAYSKIDLATGKVEAIEAPAGMPVPIVPEEITEATTIARADDAVRAKLEAAGLDADAAMANALITVPLDPEAVCARHRCLRLFFGSLRQPMPTFSVVVDMVALDVVEVADMPGEGLNP